MKALISSKTLWDSGQYTFFSEIIETIDNKFTLKFKKQYEDNHLDILNQKLSSVSSTPMHAQVTAFSPIDE